MFAFTSETGSFSLSDDLTPWLLIEGHPGKVDVLDEHSQEVLYHFA
jgi:hypothetical protein